MFGSDFFSDDYFMELALDEASKAFEMGEVPVGAVIVHDNMVVARGHNLSCRLNDATAHAEMQVITSASERLGSKYLKDCTLYVTLEPCLMCMGAIFWSQIPRLVYGASDEKKGFSTLLRDDISLKLDVTSGVLANECSALMKKFFKQLRS